jgi:membrane protease YdiL (CAAX protease family)
MADWQLADDLQPTAASLRDRPLLALLGAALPVPLAIALGTGVELLGGGTVGVVGKNLAYGTASLLVLGGLFVVLTDEERAALRLRAPGRTELSWALVGFPVGTGLYLAATAATSAAGLEMGGYEYGLADPLTVAAVVFGAVLVSPIAEETLFRGLVLGTLLGRGWHPVAAGATGILAFGVLHLPLLGPAGVIAMGAWSVVPTVLRLRFNSLGGAWAVHQFNNLWAYLGVVALGIG